MFPIKPIDKSAISRALEKAERYRLLNEPREAESICRDILAIDPDNQPALICLVLALSDLFHGLHIKADEARTLIPRLKDEFHRRYYAGVVEERLAKALMVAGYPKETIFDLLRAAMECFDQAEAIAPAGNDDGILRWNACVRIIQRERLEPAPGPTHIPESFDDDVPMR